MNNQVNNRSVLFLIINDPAAQRFLAFVRVDRLLKPLLLVAITSAEFEMHRRFARPNQSDFRRGLKAFAVHGIQARIRFLPNGCTIIEPATIDSSFDITGDDELDAELKSFMEKHCEI